MQQNKTRKIKAVFVNADESIVEVVDIEDSLKAYYEKIGCRCIDILSRKITGLNSKLQNKYFTVICDDEYLLNRDFDSAKASIFCKTNESIIYGNAIICSDDNEGELTSLSDEEIAFIKQNYMNNKTVDSAHFLEISY